MISNNDNICRGYLSDCDYLKHMIPHHQVAVDMSILLQSKTKNPIMQDILRQLIWVQNYEIHLMYYMIKKSLFDNISFNKKGMSNYIVTVADLIKPNEIGLTKTFCDPNFFDK